MPSESEALHKIQRPERFVIWASRHYLWSALRAAPVPAFVVDAFEEAGKGCLYYALDRVLVCLMAASTEAVTVHDVRCPCLSFHEQSLIMAVKSFSRGDKQGYQAAMHAIMLPSAARVCEPAMKLLAAEIYKITPERLDWLTDDDECVAVLIGKQFGVSRSIN